jgi:hypothetical protein
LFGIAQNCEKINGHGFCPLWRKGSAPPLALNGQFNGLGLKMHSERIPRSLLQGDSILRFIANENPVLWAGSQVMGPPLLCVPYGGLLKGGKAEAAPCGTAVRP